MTGLSEHTVSTKSDVSRSDDRHVPVPTTRQRRRAFFSTFRIEPLLNRMIVYPCKIKFNRIIYQRGVEVEECVWGWCSERYDCMCKW